MYYKNKQCGLMPKAPANYKLHEQIGSGQFSTVHRCTHIPTSQVYAIKCIPKYHFQQIPQLYELLQTELRLLRQLSHPNVIRLIDQHEDCQMFYIIYEYCPDGTLHSLFQRNRIGRIPSQQAKDYIQQMISALTCLHQHSLLHRDIKPANILLCQNGNVSKLSDFGFCKQTNLTHTQLGTPGYMAPEMLNGNAYDQKADVYSLGICLQQLIQHSQRDASLEQFTQIVQQMVQRDPRNRPTIFQVNQMLQNNKNLTNVNEGQIRKIRSRSQPCCQRPQQQLFNQIYLKQNQKESKQKMSPEQKKQNQVSPQIYLRLNKNKENKNLQENKYLQNKENYSPLQQQFNKNKENKSPKYLQENAKNKENYSPINNQYKQQQLNINKENIPLQLQQQYGKKYQQIQPIERQNIPIKKEITKEFKQLDYCLKEFDYYRQKYSNYFRKYR